MTEKKRISVYMPVHMIEIAKKTIGNQSRFVNEACEFYINNGGLKKWAEKAAKEAGSDN